MFYSLFRRIPHMLYPAPSISHEDLMLETRVSMPFSDEWQFGYKPTLSVGGFA
jgi:hypothetical protein